MECDKAYEELKLWSVIRLMRDSGYKFDKAYEGLRLWSVIRLMRDSGCGV